MHHGAKPAQSGKWFNALHYEVDKETGLIDYNAVEKLAIENKPKLIIAISSNHKSTDIILKPILKSTHHPINKKPHEYGALNLCQ